MANLNNIKVGSTTYDVYDNYSDIARTTDKNYAHLWTLNSALGSNGGFNTASGWMVSYFIKVTPNTAITVQTMAWTTDGGTAWCDYTSSKAFHDYWTVNSSHTYVRTVDGHKIYRRTLTATQMSGVEYVRLNILTSARSYCKVEQGGKELFNGSSYPVSNIPAGVYGDLKPSTSSNRTLGSSSKFWHYSYLDNLYITQGGYIGFSNTEECSIEPYAGSGYDLNFSSQNLYIGDIGATLHAYQDIWSDRSLKDEIGYVSLSLDDLKKIPLVLFKYKGLDRVYVGTYAQDVQPVLPQVVSEDKDHLCLDYNYLAAAINLSLVRIDEENERRLNTLKEKNKTLRARLEKIEMMILGQS